MLTVTRTEQNETKQKTNVNLSTNRLVVRSGARYSKCVHFCLTNIPVTTLFDTITSNMFNQHVCQRGMGRDRQRQKDREAKREEGGTDGGKERGKEKERQRQGDRDGDGDSEAERQRGTETDRK